MNIQKLLSELKKIGMTDLEIGLEIGAPQSIITRLRNGVHKSTSYERGSAISELAKQKLNSQ